MQNRVLTFYHDSCVKIDLATIGLELFLFAVIAGAASRLVIPSTVLIVVHSILDASCVCCE